jgi:hypothetical protein
MALRHIVLLKVAKKEDVSICVEENKKMRESLKPHVPILSFIISENIGFIPSLSQILFLSTTEFVSLENETNLSLSSLVELEEMFGVLWLSSFQSVFFLLCYNQSRGFKFCNYRFPECCLSSLVELEERFEIL